MPTSTPWSGPSPASALPLYITARPGPVRLAQQRTSYRNFDRDDENLSDDPSGRRSPDVRHRLRTARLRIAPGLRGAGRVDDAPAPRSRGLQPEGGVVFRLPQRPEPGFRGASQPGRNPRRPADPGASRFRFAARLQFGRT